MATPTLSRGVTDVHAPNIINASTDPRWDDLVAAYDRAEALMWTIGAEQDAKFKAYEVERKLLGPKPTAPGIEYPRAIADMTVAELRAFDPTPPKGALERYEAAAAAWSAQEAEIYQRLMGDVEGRWNAAVDDQNTAAQAVFGHPAPDAAALRYKLTLAEREYRNCDLDEKVTAFIFADVRRLVGQEG